MQPDAKIQGAEDVEYLSQQLIFKPPTMGLKDHDRHLEVYDEEAEYLP